jgi:hypothetical protein
MANQVFVVDPSSWSSRGADLSAGAWYCANWNGSYPGLSSDFPYTPVSEVKTIMSGDKVHALPFTGDYTECKPMTGRFSCTSRTFPGVDEGIDYQQCGDLRGFHLSFTGDIGFYNPGVPASIPLPSPPGDLMVRLRGLADTKACADLRRSLYNAPLILAERKETIDMLKRKGLQIAAVVKSRQTEDLSKWARTRNRDKRRIARDIAGEHLAILFGFLPLISEIEGVAGALAQDTPFKITGRGRASDVSETKTSIGNSSDAVVVSSRNAYYEGGLISKVRFSVRTSVSCSVTLSGAQYLRDAGFNPLATVYDLVPLSFLSDFVSNLGSFIRALDPLVGVDFLTGSSTSWIERHDNARVFGTVVKNVHDTSTGRYTSHKSVGSGEASVRVLRVHRSVLTDYPDPSLHWNNTLTLPKIGTLASLSIQRFLKPVKPLLAAKAFRYKGKRPKYLPPIKYR